MPGCLTLNMIRTALKPIPGIGYKNIYTIVMNTDNKQLKDKVVAYQEVLQNTVIYRKAWEEKTREFINSALAGFLSESGLNGKIAVNTEMVNLESVLLDLGRSSSGIAQSRETAEIRNFMIKNNGALIYQQLFNGKIMVMVQHPHIEGYGENKEPQFLEIVTPAEITEALILKHVESLLDIITQWEDFDDEGPQKKTVFQPIGFQHSVNASSSE